MNHSVPLESRPVVGAGLRRFKTTALVYTHIDNHRAGFHTLDNIFGDKHGCVGMGGMYGADSDVGAQQLLLQVNGIDDRGMQLSPDLALQVHQSVYIVVKNTHFGAQAERCAGCEFGYHAGPENNHLGRRHTTPLFMR